MKMFENRTKLAALVATPLIAFAIALIGGAFTDKAMAQNPSGGNSAQSFAVGGFTTFFSQEHVAFAAHNNPKKPGTYAGHVVQEYVDGTSNSGPVTCVQVFGTQAVVSFSVNNGVNPNTFRSFIVTDGGEPRMQTSPDAYQDCGQTNGNCDCQNGFNEPVYRGNIVVSP
jgi:hypothetical protein